MGCAVVAATAALVGPGAGSAHADDASLPVFVPHPSAWSPNYTVFPYNLWQNRVTPQMVDAERDACQWFNAQYDALSAQSWGFQNALHDIFVGWDGVQGAANVL